MKRLLFVMALFAAVGCKEDEKIVLPDAPPAPTTCNLFAQTGCAAGEKCAWVWQQTTPESSIGKLDCVPNGTVALGGDCQWGASGSETGYDNCQAGLVCKANSSVSGAAGICVEDCSTDAVTDTCSEGYACAQYANFFDINDNTIAGFCDPQCDPLTGNAWDGDGFDDANCGGGVYPPEDPDAGLPQLACIFSFGSAAGAPLSASCAANRNPSFAHRQPPANPGDNLGRHFANDCPTGYKLFGAGDGAGSEDKVTCLALCQPADVWQGNTAKLAGEPGNSCNDPHPWQPVGSAGRASTDPEPGTNCAYSWWLAPRGAGLPLELANGVGVCMLRKLYQYTTGEELESCADLSNTPEDDGTSPAWKNGCKAVSETGGEVAPTLQGLTNKGSQLHLARQPAIYPFEVERVVE